MAITVTGLVTTPVKGTRVHEVPHIELGDRGARGDRAFFVIDERGWMMNGKNFKTLQTVVADYDLTAGTLALTFPDGDRADGVVEYGETVTTRFFSRPKEARELRGPWSAALSEFFGQPLRLVATESAVDRGREGAISVISRASLRHLADVAECDTVDGRRFRMLIEVDGIGAHEEDAWLGRRVRIGAALVRPQGHVGRCVITTRNPDTAEGDLDTLKLLATYRHKLDTTEPLAFGIHGEVLEGGSVRIGDPVTVEDR
ncbi:MAG: MOSC domain-containing protein [Solirubrobacteraceae bacterium]